MNAQQEYHFSIEQPFEGLQDAETSLPFHAHKWQEDGAQARAHSETRSRSPGATMARTFEHQLAQDLDDSHDAGMTTFEQQLAQNLDDRLDAGMTTFEHQMAQDLANDPRLTAVWQE